MGFDPGKKDGLFPGNRLPAGCFAILDDSPKSKGLKHVWQIYPEHHIGTNPAALFC
jgi:hypothetical protein